MPLELVKQISLDEEYKKDTGISPQDIALMRTWLHTQPHLPADHITDLDLILAYHCCERSSEVSKQVLDLNFTLKTAFSGLFKDWVVNDKIEKSLKTMLITPLPTRTKEGYTCFYISFLDCNPKNFNLANTLRLFFMEAELLQYEEGTWPGVMLLVDLKGMVLGHLAAFDLQVVEQFFFYLQEAMFVKLKGLHYINAPSFMDKLLSLLKPFLKKRVLNMLHIHQVGSETLEKFYSKDGLPKEAGGSYKSFMECRDETLSKLKANQDFFLLESKKRVVEKLRPNKSKITPDFCSGVEGSFKALSID